jgi:hypothetical protein
MQLSASTESSQPTKHKEPLYYSAAQIFTTIQNPHKKEGKAHLHTKQIKNPTMLLVEKESERECSLWYGILIQREAKESNESCKL